MLKNIIFDFDGVIIDSHQVQILALKTAYQAVGGSGAPPYKDFFLHSGDSLHNIFMKLGLPVEMVAIYNQVSSQNAHKINLVDGMKELLQSLYSIEKICALLTGKDRFRTLELLELHNLKQYFQLIICSDDIQHPKPHIQGVTQIIETLHIQPQETILIGDGVNDIICAKNSGIRSIAVTWGETSREQLALTDPDLIVDTVQELQSHLFPSIV